MLKTIAALLLGAVVTTGAIVSNAHAGTVPPLAPQSTAQTNGFQNADVNFSIGVGNGYNRGRHGNRCQFRRYGCDNYYQGYYYQNPWWLVPGIVIGSNGYGNGYDDDYGYRNRSYRYSNRNVSFSRSHVQWCSDRYRSYDRRSNTWISNSGQRRQCNSPY